AESICADDVALAHRASGDRPAGRSRSAQKGARCRVPRARPCRRWRARILDRRAGWQRDQAALGRDPPDDRHLLTPGHRWSHPDPGHKDGIYFLVPALIAVLVGGVVNAWLIFVRLD